MNAPKRPPTANTTLVVCEDDGITLELLCAHLAADGFEPLAAPTASDALRLCREHQPDLLLLDLSFADASGLDVLQQLRNGERAEAGFDPDLPVIVLGGSGAEDFSERCLEAGADEYLPKPFHYPQLRARIAAVLRSHARRQSPIRVGDLAIDPDRRRVRVGCRDVQLSDKEFGLLRVLASDPIRIFSKRELLEEVWGFRTEARARTLDAHASRLRRKLDPEDSLYVINCWGVGYRLIDGVASGAAR